MQRAGVPFSVKIRRLLVLFGLIAFAVVFAVSAFYESMKLKAELSEVMRGLAGTTGSLLRESIMQHRRTIEELTAAVPEGSDNDVRRYFLENLPLLGPEDSYFILNSAGRVIHASRRSRDFLGLDFSHLPVLHDDGEISGVHQSLATLKPVVTVTYKLSAGRLMVVERDLFSLAPLVGHLKLLGPVRQGTFFILTESGTVVYHPDERLVANRSPLGFELRQWSQGDSFGLQEYTHRGERYLCLRQPLAVPHGWTFYAAVPRHEFLRFVAGHLAYQASVLAVLFVALGGLLHVLISRMVSKPVQCVAAHLATFNPLEDNAACEAALSHNTTELNQIVAACERMAANIRQANEQLRSNEARFRALVENGADAFHVQDFDGRFLDVNHRACEMLGYTREELLAMGVADIDPDHAVADVRRVCESIPPGGAITIQSRHRRKDGTCLPVEIRAGLVPWGERTLVFSLVRDVSERQKAAEALAAEKELLAVTLRSIGDGVVAVDVGGRVLMLSRMAEQLTGWREEEARGRPLDEIFRLVDRHTREPRESPVPKVLATGQIATLAMDTLLIARDGSERLVADSGAPIFDRESRVIGAVVAFRDITEHHRLEQELHRVHKLESLGVLAGGIAHDFNNLLTAIIGNLSLARLDAPEAPLQRQLEAAENAALRAQGLTQQLLTFAKGGTPIKAVASIAELIREAAEFSLHGSKTRYTLESPPDLWPVEVDAAQMSQVVNNLILNADQAMPSGGTITIELANRHLDPSHAVPLPPGPYVEIRVADQGHGIAPDHLERIFDPYFSTKQTGSGLGLASCYSIIKRHGGHISVASWPSEGAVFAIYLPAQPGKMVATLAAAAGEPLAGQGRVLVLDDEEMVRELAQAVLERLGYEADCAEEGGRALAMYQEAKAAGRPYDVVIMDLTIPGGMGGQEAMKELLRIDPQARAIVSSGYAQDPVMANYRDHGFSAVLAKPYSLEALSRVLYEVLRGKEGIVS